MLQTREEIRQYWEDQNRDRFSHLAKKLHPPEQAWIKETRAKINEGFAAFEREKTLNSETFVNQLLEELEQRYDRG